MALAKHLKENKVSLAFFSATPQGTYISLIPFPLSLDEKRVIRRC